MNKEEIYQLIISIETGIIFALSYLLYGEIVVKIFFSLVIVAIAILSIICIYAFWKISKFWKKLEEKVECEKEVGN